MTESIDAPDPRAVMSAFGLPGAPTSYIEVDGAWSNRVLRLRTTHGTYAVKELRNPWGEPRWAQWLDESWQLEVAALAAGVSMPLPVPAPDGACFIDVERVDGAGEVPVRLHRWVDGVRPSVADVGTELAVWTGRTLATVHSLRVHPRDATLFPVPTTASVQAWPDLCARASAADAAWSPQLSATRGVVVRAADLLVPTGDRTTVMSHGDLTLKNLLVTSSGPVLCDWDVAMPRVPAWDLAEVAVSIAAWRDRYAARIVRSAYTDAGGELVAPSPHDLGPALMVRLDFISLLVHRALALRSTTPGEQAAADAQLPDLLAVLPRQIVLAESIDAWLG